MIMHGETQGPFQAQCAYGGGVVVVVVVVVGGGG